MATRITCDSCGCEIPRHSKEAVRTYLHEREAAVGGKRVTLQVFVAGGSGARMDLCGPCIDVAISSAARRDEAKADKSPGPKA